MSRNPLFERVILVVIDGLRADAIDALRLPNLVGLKKEAAWTVQAQTVRPSVTAAAMTSLFCGVPPEEHGIGTSTTGFAVPPAIARFSPVSRQLAGKGYTSRMFLADLPFGYSWLASKMATVACVNFRAAGNDAVEILGSAASAIYGQRSGLVAMHWPDCERAGHTHGWSSHQYAAAARTADTALGLLIRTLSYGEPGTLLMICADHGGGGVRERDHDSNHPLDTTIPIFLAGDGVTPGILPPEVSLLDLPATILYALGADIPIAYRGRPLVEAFSVPALAA